jgi:hypothetical protein
MGLFVVAMAIDESCAFTSLFHNLQNTPAGPIIVPRRSSTRSQSSREYFLQGRNNLIRLNLREMENADDIDNDGWGDGDDVVIGEKSDRSRELAMLQEDLASKREVRKSLDSRTAKSGGEEKDLFIPIVTLVSVIGFTGLYGYEMLRLYLRGELYLPWER